MLYVGRNYTATLSGSTVKDVTCAKCGDRYLYRMVRQATGEGTSPYMLDNAGAQRRAEEKARAALEHALHTHCEVVPCPNCSHLQPDMVRKVRGQRLGWMNWVGWIGGFLALIGLAIYVGTLSRYDDTTPALVVGCTIAAAFFGLTIYRLFANARYDPNADGSQGAWASNCESMRFADYEQAAAAEQQAQAAGPLPVIPIAGDEEPAPAAAPATQWYYSSDGTQRGPVPDDALQALAATGQLDPDDSVWTDGMPAWVPAGTIDGLFPNAATAAVA